MQQLPQALLPGDGRATAGDETGATRWLDQFVRQKGGSDEAAGCGDKCLPGCGVASSCDPATNSAAPLQTSSAIPSALSSMAGETRREHGPHFPVRVALSGLPFLLIGGLLYAALFIKPSPQGVSLAPPVMSRGDVVYGVASPAKGVLWAVGSDGKVWHSDDSATSWRLQTAATPETLQDIAAWDAQRAVAVGNQGVVLRTIDGGATWAPVLAPLSTIANKLMRVRAFSDGEAWAVGEAGAVLHTRDYGANWHRAAPEEDAAWNDVHRVGSRIILVGEFGRIRVSRDSGTSWADAVSPVRSSLMSVSFRDATTGMAVGLDGVVLKTDDAGDSWVRLTNPDHNHLFDVIWDGGNWVAAGNKGVLVTADGEAKTWKASLISKTERAWHTRIVRVESGYVAVGQKVDVIDAMPL